jgi:ribonuclease T1
MPVRCDLPALPRVFARQVKVGILLLLWVLGGIAFNAYARTTPEAPPDIALADLPKEAREVYGLVGSGGPFPFDRDGVVFGNRERLLPAKPRGYYHEYTVPTPGVKSRGGRRLVCGGKKNAPDACYYSDDHYRSFRKIRT